MAVTVTDAAGREITIEGIDSTRQPKWLDEELIILYDVFQKEGPYKDRDYSQFFRMMQKALPHRTLASALDRIHDAQIEQKIPYYGALPMQDARQRDTSNAVNVLYALVDWKAKQAANKKKAPVVSGGTGISDDLAYSIIELLTGQNKILADCHKFLAGIYRRACGDDGKFVQVEIMRQPVEIGMADIARINIDSMVFAPATEDSDPDAEHITMVHTASDGTIHSQRFDVLHGPVRDEINELGISTLPNARNPVQATTDAPMGIRAPRVPQGPPPMRPPDTQ